MVTWGDICATRRRRIRADLSADPGGARPRTGPEWHPRHGGRPEVTGVSFRPGSCPPEARSARPAGLVGRSGPDGVPGHAGPGFTSGSPECRPRVSLAVLGTHRRDKRGVEAAESGPAIFSGIVFALFGSGPAMWTAARLRQRCPVAHGVSPLRRRPSRVSPHCSGSLSGRGASAACERCRRPCPRSGGDLAEYATPINGKRSSGWCRTGRSTLRAAGTVVVGLPFEWPLRAFTV
jgi:hypothetical protein